MGYAPHASRPTEVCELLISLCDYVIVLSYKEVSMTTVTENLDRARKIRDENKAKLVEYIKALEVVSDMIADTETPWNGSEINEANKTARHLRAQIGGRK